MVEIIDCEQGTEEWFRARMGIPTASEFRTVMAQGPGGYGAGDPKERRRYMLKLIGERITGEPMEHYSNKHTERGHEMEPDARALYEFLTGNVCTPVGFVRNRTTNGYLIGYSPDSFIGDKGALEVKSKLPHLHFECLLSQKIPHEHYAQCQGGLWVSERDWIAFMSYWPNTPPFIQVVERDENFIRFLASELAEFCEDMERVQKIIMSGNITGPVSTRRLRENPILVKGF